MALTHAAQAQAHEPSIWKRMRNRIALSMLGNGAAARSQLAGLLARDPGYRGPVLKTRTRTLVACGDHYAWVLNGDTGVGQGLLKKGHWQRDDFDSALRVIIQRNGRCGDTFVDVGANIGTTSLYAALSGRFSRIVAIEPEPRNAALILENFSLNDMPSRIDVVLKAVGPYDGRAFLNLHATDSGVPGGEKTSQWSGGIVPLRGGVITSHWLG